MLDFNRKSSDRIESPFSSFVIVKRRFGILRQIKYRLGQLSIKGGRSVI